MNRRPKRCDKVETDIDRGWQRVVDKRIVKTWYVSTRIPHREKTGHYSRRSHTFASESDAKKFAAAKVAEGIEVHAGTLNPVVPRRTIGPSEIAKWLAERTKMSAIGDPPS
jgi:hypothetical protein